MNKPSKTIYMDGVDFQHELGEAMGGNVVFGSMEDLKEHSKCWESCGIVKCTITVEEWASPQDLFKDAVPMSEVNDVKHDIERLQNLKDRKLRTEMLIEQVENRIKEK